MVITLTIKQAGYCISKHWKDLQPKVAQEMLSAVRVGSQKLHLYKSCFWLERKRYVKIYVMGKPNNQ